MKQKYLIHPDFAKAPVFNLKFSPGVIGFCNRLMTLQRTIKLRKTPADLTQTKMTIARSKGGPLKVLVIRPKALEKPAPVIIYFHGGAFALTYAALHVELCQRYAREAQCSVVFVDYRLAPANPWPSGFDDSYRALEWVINEAKTLCINPESIVLAGDSAGAALAASVAQKALDHRIPVAGELLVYPVTDNSCTTDSATSFTDTPVWNSVSNQRMWDAYLGNQNLNQAPQYAVPAQRKSLAGLPATYIETAEFDPLRDEGIEYANQLRAAGVSVALNETQGTVHGYDFATKNPVVEASITSRIEFLRRSFKQVTH